MKWASKCACLLGMVLLLSSVAATSSASEAGTFHRVAVTNAGCADEDRTFQIARLSAYPSQIAHPNGGDFIDALERCDVDKLDIEVEYAAAQWGADKAALDDAGWMSPCDSLPERAQEIDDACVEKPADYGGESSGCSASLVGDGCEGECCDGWGVIVTCYTLTPHKN
jgi:hypothetical protein